MLANAAQVKNVPGRKTDVADATWLAELLAHGLVRASFVPDAPTQALRALLRTRKQLVRERASHVQRLQKTLEDANIKLASVLADVTGVSGRAIVEALVAGETDPATLAALAHQRVKAPRERLTERRCAGGSRPTTASCCGCTCARSTPWRRRSPRSTERWRRTSRPFAPRSGC